MKKSIIIIFVFSSLPSVYSMNKKNYENLYYGTIISIKQEGKSNTPSFPLLIIDRNNYYAQLQEGLRIYGRQSAISTYGLSAASFSEHACSLTQIIYFVYNNRFSYAHIEFIVKTKEEIEMSKEKIQNAIRLADMDIKSILGPYEIH